MTDDCHIRKVHIRKVQRHTVRIPVCHSSPSQTALSSLFYNNVTTKDSTAIRIILMCKISHVYNKRCYVCLSICLYLCSVWPAKRLGRSRPNLTHALMSTQGVFLSRSMSRSFTYACGSDRITKHPECCAKATPGKRCSNYVRRTGEATPGKRLRNSVRRTGNYS